MAKPAWLVAFPLAFVAVAFVAPMAVILAEAATPAALEYATSPFVRHVLGIAFEQAAWSTVLAMALAIPLAWLHHARRVPMPRLQLAVHAAPFVMPVFVIVYGLQGVLGDRGWLQAATGLDVLSWLGPFGTVVLAHAYYNYGFAARLLEATLRRRPRTLEAAARTLGASPMRAFARTTLPLILPQILSTAILVFLFTFGSFGVVLFMGQGQVFTLETAMARQIGTPFGDMSRAAALGALELGVNALMLVGYLALRRRSLRSPAEPGQPAPRASKNLAFASWAFAALAALPILAVLVQGFRHEGQWSLKPWQALLHALPCESARACAVPADFDLASALGLSALYAFASTTFAIALTACLAYGARHLPRLRRPLEAFASLPVAGSGLLLGVAFLGAFGVRSVWRLDGTVWIVLLAHTVLAFPFVARLLLPAFETRDTRLDESARLLGATPSQVVARIHWPLLRPTLLAATGLALALSLGDFGASSMLMESGTRGLSVWIRDVDAPFSALAHSSAVALAGLLCAITLAAYLVVERAGLRDIGVRRFAKGAR